MLILPDSDGEAQARLLKQFWQGLRRHFSSAGAPSISSAESPASPGPSGNHDMPTIRIEMIAGRTPEQKRALVKGVTECFTAHCGGTPASVQVVISEFGKDQWAIGGELISDRKT